jgi:hypothetical protein
LVRLSPSKLDSVERTGAFEGESPNNPRSTVGKLLGGVSPYVSIADMDTDGLPSPPQFEFRRYLENIAYRSSMARAFAAVEVSTAVICLAIVDMVTSISFCLDSRVESLPPALLE